MFVQPTSLKQIELYRQKVMGRSRVFAANSSRILDYIEGRCEEVIDDRNGATVEFEIGFIWILPSRW